MNQNNIPYKNKREELEVRINDAADGLLSGAQRQQLEKDLEAWPDLMQDYRSILNMPDLSGIYDTPEAYRDDRSVQYLIKQLDKEDLREASFNELSLLWFKKYAVAASLLILGAISVFNLTQPDLLNGDMTLDEFIYSYEEESIADVYVHYLDEWME